MGVTVSGLGSSSAEANKTLTQNMAFSIKIGVVKDILNENGTPFTDGEFLV